MRWLIFALALASPACAQYGNFNQAIDICSGQSTFLGSNVIIEESTGFCNAKVSTVVVSSGTVTVTLASGYTTAGIDNTSPNDDKVFLSGTGVTCLDGSSGFVSSVPSSSEVAFPLACSDGMYSPSNAVLSAVYLSSSNFRWQLNVVTQNASGKWSDPATISVLTPTGANRNSVVGSACGVGNPAGYTDGTNYYLAFLGQTGAGCGGSSEPDKGIKYSLFVCNLSSGITSAYFSSSYCSNVRTYNSSQSGAMLDPHIHKLPSGAVDVYVSERNNSVVYPAVNNPTPATSYGVWSIDDFQVTWSSPPVIGTSPLFYVFDDATWHTDARGTGGCEQYYKLTGFSDLPNGNLRVFFQSNDIKTGSPGANPYSALSNPPFTACDQLGAGTGTDAFDFSGIFYSDLTSSAYLTTIYQGANYTQLYPPANAQCVDAAGNIACYGEFPWALKDASKLYFTGSLFTDARVLNACANIPYKLCQPNFNNEQLSATLVTDFTQPTTLPMSILSVRPWTNYNVPGTAACGALLSATNSSANCGVLGSPPAFGGCSHLDIDEATSTVTCGNFTNFNDPRGLPSARTFVISLADSPFFAPMQATGGVTASGGVSFLIQ